MDTNKENREGQVFLTKKRQASTEFSGEKNSNDKVEKWNEEENLQ